MGIDLNADLGEESPHESELFKVVTSANISCGAHAGGGEFLSEAIRSAISHEVAIGAHPSYPDRENFGRISMLESMSLEQLVESIIDQLAVFLDLLHDQSGTLHHFKAHGALYNDALVDQRAADAILTALAHVERDMGLRQTPILTMNGRLAQTALHRGRQVIFEFFADRAYRSDGTLEPRTHPGSVFHDPEVISERTLRFLNQGQIVTVDGLILTSEAESICVHGDNPHALAIAQHLRTKLSEEGIHVRAV